MTSEQIVGPSVWSLDTLSSPIIPPFKIFEKLTTVFELKLFRLCANSWHAHRFPKFFGCFQIHNVQLFYICFTIFDCRKNNCNYETWQLWKNSLSISFANSIDFILDLWWISRNDFYDGLSRENYKNNDVMISGDSYFYVVMILMIILNVFAFCVSFEGLFGGGGRVWNNPTHIVGRKKNLRKFHDDHLFRYFSFWIPSIVRNTKQINLPNVNILWRHNFNLPKIFVMPN